MPRSLFAQIRWEEPRPRAEREVLGAVPTPKHPLSALVERTKVPRHRDGDKAEVQVEAEFLLGAAAEVEHQFVVQYLFAYYSLNLDRRTRR
jgi:hypothetical protein